MCVGIGPGACISTPARRVSEPGDRGWLCRRLQECCFCGGASSLCVRHARPTSPCRSMCMPTLMLACCALQLHKACVDTWNATPLSCDLGSLHTLRAAQVYTHKPSKTGKKFHQVTSRKAHPQLVSTSKWHWTTPTRACSAEGIPSLTLKCSLTFHPWIPRRVTLPGWVVQREIGA